jgi:hypothetical protein
MVHTEPSEGSKYKPRGRPFPKGNKRGKLENQVLASSGRESSVEGGVIAPALESSIVDPANDGIFHQLPKLVMETIDNTLKECMETKEEIKPIEEVKEEPTKKEADELEIVETVDFKNGDNILSLRFSKLHNRSFRIQVFLNNENEIRPVTYTGARTGFAFWNLLKGALKK